MTLQPFTLALLLVLAVVLGWRGGYITGRVDRRRARERQAARGDRA